jgi:hypothetical protein
MPRQQPQTLSSSPGLRGAAAALRSAVKESLPDAMEKIANATAGALEGMATGLESLEARLRRLSTPNVPDPLRRTPLLVSGDRILGGVNVQGALSTVRGQSLDLTFANQTGTVESKDHVSGNNLPLVLKGTGVVISSQTTSPANSAAPGTDGEIRMDNSYIYVHTGGSWRRAAVATF